MRTGRDAFVSVVSYPHPVLGKRPNLDVRTGLRAAVMPFLPAVNPCITTMMIGEKCANMIKSDRAALR